MIYFIILSFLLLVLSFDKGSKIEKLSLLPLLMMIILCGFRGYDVGTDTESYLDSYNSRNLWDYSVGEPLYNLSMDIARFIGLGNTGFLLLTALLTYVPLYTALRKMSPNINYSMLIYVTFSVYFFCNSFNVIRNSISASFILFVLYYISQKEYKRIVIYSLVAIGFHFSAIAILPLLYVAYKIENIDIKYAYAILFVSVIWGLSSNYRDVATLLNAQLMRYDNSIVEHYNTIYFNDLAGHEFNANGIIMQIAPITLCSMLSFLTNSCNKYLRAILFLGAILGNIFVSILYVYRITLFLNIVAIVILPQIIESRVTQKGVRICVHSLVLMLFTYFIICAIKESEAFVVFPYHFA